LFIVLIRQGVIVSIFDVASRKMQPWKYCLGQRLNCRGLFWAFPPDRICDVVCQIDQRACTNSYRATQNAPANRGVERQMKAVGSQDPFGLISM
jgi:hypothetical protein